MRLRSTGVVEPDPERSARCIENLIATYAELVDAGDFGGLGELLADAVFGGEGDAVVSGRDAIEKIFAPWCRSTRTVRPAPSM